jgi:uncharacterized protein
MNGMDENAEPRDPSVVAESTAQPRFVADVNVGRLARRLRMLGFDVVFPRTTEEIDDGRLVAVAAGEGRVLLTRDTYILHRRIIHSGEVRAVLITRDDANEQLRQVFRALHLAPPFGFLTRCLDCNVPLVPISRAEIVAEVPQHVYRTQTSFNRCPRCGRIFWPGTHRDHMLAELNRLVSEIES